MAVFPSRWYRRIVLPAWVTSPNPEDAREDERIRAMSPDERLAELVQIWKLMDSILAGRPDREAELARRDELPAGWLEVVERGRRAREAG
jgi:hypothetical protein